MLIVDDDQVMRLLERETLTRFDFEVSEAIDGQSALDMLASAIPSLVLLDVEMAGLDGFQVCRRIRENWDATDLPVVMVTGMDDLRSINQAYMAGANDFIAKPINWPMLGHRARYVVRSAQAARRLRALEEKQAAITRAIPDMIFVHDAQGRYLDFKPAFGQQPFVPPEDFLGKHLTSVLPTDAAEVIQHGIERALGRQGLQAVNYKLPMPDGLHHYEARIAPSGENQVVIV
ncbi:MAG TPA: response regulator, partial [Accumulibacter sp.]|nr:response regulator [Accumulibacter sp.]